MSKPLTDVQKKYLNECYSDDIVCAALARLDFLERKVQAAEAVQLALDDGDVSLVNKAMNAYDEVLSTRGKHNA